jgi:undecaprenyl-diphosphatase
MWHVTKIYVFAPVFAYVLYLFYRQLGWKRFLLMLACIGLCVLFADRISSGFFKPFFERLRPTHALGEVVHTVHGYRGGRFGFVSSHAANMFAIAVYTLLVFRRRWYTFFMLPLALLVAYSRIYLGVHYPLDIIGGALLGAAIGATVYLIYREAARRFLF